MEVILVYLILALVLIWSENGSSRYQDRDDRTLEHKEYKPERSEQVYYRDHKQPEYLRYSEVEDLDMSRSRSLNSKKF